MEDSRRPFTPLIPQDVPTPEDRSPSPTGGRTGSKASKTTSGVTGGQTASTDSTISPYRKSQIKEMAGKKEKTQTKKGSTATGAATNRETAAGRKSKEGKATTGGAAQATDKDSLDDTLTKQSLFDASSSIKLYDANELTASIMARPDSQAQMRAESAMSIHAPSTIAETGYVPFSIEPAFGRCEPGKTVVCKVIFFDHLELIFLLVFS